ncbi:uncharacterized protein LOC108901548 isoform X1 [Lates calcarifer]|uniref:Uncharacterized protein LOC108898755 n=1 Tax=Lates calcarifer TaxID=8187 RepID=A0AAJ7QKG5_LATCA|nr:uncharacterized protein LOC108898755 [Lates calcarifer]XP_018558579.1 uncharacterized protein LOC108901548 isoform X1 [Lates calcarifer]
MEYLSRYLSTNKATSLICCVFWIFSPAEGDIISEVAGSSVSMHCNNNSINTLQQLTWRLNGVTLISFKPPTETYVNEKANSLNINMSKSESQLYALIIESLQESHIGNYTCDTATETGTWKQTWELIVITETAVRLPLQKWRKQRIFMRIAWKLIVVDSTDIVSLITTSPELFDITCNPEIQKGKETAKRTGGAGGTWQMSTATTTKENLTYIMKTFNLCFLKTYTICNEEHNHCLKAASPNKVVMVNVLAVSYSNIFY